MPYKSKSKRRTARPGKRRSYGRPRARISRHLMPVSKLVKMKYNQSITLNPGTASGAYQYFRANSVYDPYQSGGGHQPMGFDQLMLFYDHYRVVGARITCTFYPTVNDYVVGIVLDDDFTPLLDLDHTLEQPRVAYRHLCSQAGRPTTVSMNYSAKRILGPAAYSDSNKGSATSNPPETTFFTPFAYGANALTDPNFVNVTISISYIVQLTEPTTLPSS